MSNILGADITLNVSIEKINGLTMDDLDFKCLFFTTIGQCLQLDKSQLIRVDSSNYLACINTADLSCGKLFMRIYVKVPDSNYEKKHRLEIVNVDTGVLLVK